MKKLLIFIALLTIPLTANAAGDTGWINKLPPILKAITSETKEPACGVACSDRENIYIHESLFKIVKTYDEFLFCVLHEYGHIVLHHLDVVNSLGGTPEKLSEEGYYQVSRIHEYQADRLAAIVAKKFGAGKEVCNIFLALPFSAGDGTHPATIKRYVWCLHNMSVIDD